MKISKSNLFMRKSKNSPIMKGLWVLAVLATTFASCSQDQDAPSVSGKKGDALLNITGNASNMVTKATGVEMAAGTNVGVYVYETGLFDVTSTPFQNYQYAATGANGKFNATTAIYLSHAKSYSALAYAPFQSTVANPKIVSFDHGTDVMYAATVPVSISGTDPAFTASAQLLFKHLMSQLKFSLISGNGTPDLTGATLRVTGFNQSATLNLADGTFAPVKGDGAAITDIDKAVCFAADNADMALHLTVTTSDGKVYSGTLTKTFASGTSYSYKITVNNNDTKLDITGTVIDWIPVDGGSISVEG